MALTMPNKVHDCIGHGPEMKPSKRYGQKSPVRGWFGREGKSSTWSASAIPGSCADFLGRSSGGIERYQPCAHTHVITLSWMSVYIQTAPGEFAQLRGGTSTNLVATAMSIMALPRCIMQVVQGPLKRLRLAAGRKMINLWKSSNDWKKKTQRNLVVWARRSMMRLKTRKPIRPGVPSDYAPSISRRLSASPQTSLFCRREVGGFGAGVLQDL